MSTDDTLRIYGSLRTAHLERFRDMTPATVLYRKRRYDFDESVLDGGPHPVQMSRLGTLRHLLTHSYRYVEVNEPFVSTRWFDLIGQILAIRVRGALTRSRTRVSAYCIGYSDPAAELADRRQILPERIARTLTWVAVNVLVRWTDRLAFGTSGSMAMYGSYVREGVLSPRSRLFEALPSPCDCPAPVESGGRDHRVLFVGSFQARKGIAQLMAAWDVLRLANPHLTLQLIGKGPMLAEVQTWAASRSEVTVDVDPPRTFIHAALRRAGVLVLLSQRIGSWREQIGLPVVEGLAHGAVIVTTTETGLADWLHHHEHQVVDRAAGDEAVADAIIRAARSGRSSSEVLADLPVIDQRSVADQWMLTQDAEGNLP